MGLLQTKQKVSRDFILSKLEEGQIWEHYFGSFSFDKSYNSVLRKDRTASTGFYISRSGKIIYNDLATGTKHDIFSFVGALYNLSYGDAINKIAEDFGLIGNMVKRIEKTAYIAPEYVKKDTKIDIEYKKWDDAALSYWKDYYITQRELEENDVYNVNKLRINSKFIPNMRGNLRFAYILNHEGKVYKKIYEPHAPKEFKWFNNTPIYLVGGHDKLKFNNDTLILLKSTKDMMVVRKLHPECLQLQNESTAALKDVTLEFLKTKYKKIVGILDNDTRGIEACEEYRQRGIETYHLPVELHAKSIKDPADLVKAFGMDCLKRFLINNKII